MERSMKKTIIAIIVAFFPLLANAQEQYADSIVYRPAAAVDSTLLGKSIFNILSAHSYGEGDIRIHQSQAITNAMKQYISGNSSRNSCVQKLPEPVLQGSGRRLQDEVGSHGIPPESEIDISGGHCGKGRHKLPGHRQTTQLRNRYGQRQKTVRIFVKLC